jgi:hypothetical protein
MPGFRGLPRRVPIVFQNRSRGRPSRFDCLLDLVAQRRIKMANPAAPITRVRSPFRHPLPESQPTIFRAGVIDSTMA